MNDSRENFDPAEQQKFDRIAASWWDPDGESRPLHDLNPARLAYITERAALEGARVVDVGCGGGILSESLAGHPLRCSSSSEPHLPLRAASVTDSS